MDPAVTCRTRIVHFLGLRGSFGMERNVYSLFMNSSTLPLEVWGPTSKRKSIFKIIIRSITTALRRHQLSHEQITNYRIRSHLHLSYLFDTT